MALIFLFVLKMESLLSLLQRADDIHHDTENSSNFVKKIVIDEDHGQVLDCP